MLRYIPKCSGLIAVLLISSNLFSQANLTDSIFGTNGRVYPSFDRLSTYDDLFFDKKNRIMVSKDTILGNGDKAVVMKRFNTSGQPDITFNGNGVLVINQQPNNNEEFDYEYSSSLLFLSDHRITFTIETEVSETWYRLNENGTPDAGFGTNGKKTVPNGLDLYTTAVTSDNRFIAVEGESGVIKVRKFTTAGNPDNSFGTNGLKTITGSPLTYVDQVLIQSDNKIIITGEGDSYNVLYVQRLNPTGSIDGSYGENGLVEYVAESEFGDSFEFFFPQLTSDGKLLFSGTDEYTSTALLRLKNNGEPDETFGTNGLLTFQFYEDTRMIYSGSASTGTSTWIGGFQKTNNRYNFLAGKRTNNGAPDASFGTAGFATIEIGNHDAMGFFMKEVDNGKILLMGYGMVNNYYGMTILQLQSNGNIDNSFGNNGMLHIKGVDPTKNSEYDATVLAHLIPGPDNSTLHTGTYEDGIEASFYIQKLNDNGTPDNTFGTNSWTAITPMYYYNSGDGKIVRQPDGKIVIACNIYDVFTGFNIMLQRITATGQPDNSFGTGGRTLIKVSENPFEEFTIIDLKAGPNGKIAVMAIYEDIDLEKMQTPIFQLTENGQPDNSFSDDGKLMPDFTASKLGYTTDNKVVAFGYKDTDPALCCLGLAIRKYNTNGLPDATFNGGNQVSVKYSSENDEPVALIIEPDNMVTVLFTPFNSDKDYGIAKFTASGTALPGWGTNGVLTVAGPGSDLSQFWVNGLKSDNGGFIFADQGGFSLKILKTLPNGLPDNSFSTDGLGEVSFGEDSDYELAGLFLKPGGKIMVGGNATDPSDPNQNYSYKAVLTQLKTSSTIAVTYTLINPGNWSNAANWQNGQVPPSTITAGTEIIINPGGNGEATLDTNVVVLTGGKIIVKPGKKLNVAANLTVPAITTE